MWIVENLHARVLAQLLGFPVCQSHASERVVVPADNLNVLLLGGTAHGVTSGKGVSPGDSAVIAGKLPLHL